MKLKYFQINFLRARYNSRPNETKIKTKAFLYIYIKKKYDLSNITTCVYINTLFVLKNERDWIHMGNVCIYTIVVESWNKTKRKREYRRRVRVGGLRKNRRNLYWKHEKLLFVFVFCLVIRREHVYLYTTIFIQSARRYKMLFYSIYLFALK